MNVLRQLPLVGCVALVQENESTVVAKICFQQLRVTIEPQTTLYQPVEMTYQEIRQVEGPRFLLGQRVEDRRTRKELVAMRTGQTLDPVVGNYRVDTAAGTTIRVGDEDMRVQLAIPLDGCAQQRRDPFRSVVQIGRQALYLQMRPLIHFAQCDQLPGNGAAGNQQNRGSHVRNRSG